MSATSPQALPPQSASDLAVDLIDVKTLLSGLWRGKWLVILAIALGLFKGVTDLRQLGDIFEASMTVSPIASSQTGLGSGAAAGLQSLGISLSGAKQANNFDRFQLLLGSADLAGILINRYGALTKVFETAWDENTKTWRDPSARGTSDGDRLRRFLKKNVWIDPNADTLAHYIKTTVKVKEVGQFHRVSFAHGDREFALWFLKTVYLEAENLIRIQDSDENRQRRRYLEEQLQRATVIEVRQSLVQLITSEERQAMMMQGSLPYVAKVMLAPTADRQPIEPDFAIVILPPVLTLAGLAILLLVMVSLMSGELFRSSLDMAKP